MRKTLFTIATLFAIQFLCAQKEIVEKKLATPEQIEEVRAGGETIEHEKALNVFAAAGVSTRIGTHYNVTVSPIDRTIQFETVSPINFSLTTGFIWNPFTLLYEVKYPKDNSLEQKYEYRRTAFAVALLINVYNLNAGGTKTNYASAIDGGFGIGYNKDNFAVLGTVEFSALRQPRKYFIDTYKDKNKTLILYGSNEPTLAIDDRDNSMFISKFYASIGLKIAYSFGVGK